MKAEEFNQIAKDLARETIFKHGFQSKNVHFFKQKENQIITLYKNSFRGTFTGHYLAITFDFLCKTDKKGVIKLPTYLEDYPICIPINLLQSEFSKFKTIDKFKSPLNFHFQKSSPLQLLESDELMTNQNNVRKEIQKTMNVFQSLGLEFAQQLTPILTHKILSKLKGKNHWALDQFIEKLESNGFRSKKSFLDKLFK